MGFPKEIPRNFGWGLDLPLALLGCSSSVSPSALCSATVGLQSGICCGHPWFHLGFAVTDWAEVPHPKGQLGEGLGSKGRKTGEETMNISLLGEKLSKLIRKFQNCSLPFWCHPFFNPFRAEWDWPKEAKADGKEQEYFHGKNQLFPVSLCCGEPDRNQWGLVVSAVTNSAGSLGFWEDVSSRNSWEN